MYPDNFFYQHDDRNYLSAEGYAYLKAHDDLFIDATQGGLIMAPSLLMGGFRLVSYTVKGEFFVNDPVDGWCYLLNAYADFHCQQELSTLTISPVDAITFRHGYEVPETVSIFNACPRLIDGQSFTPFVFTGSPQMGIVDRVTTKRHIARLDQLNRQAWETYFTGYRKNEEINGIGTAAYFVPRHTN
ncbi:hypothetical protein G8759_06170 [Spirosoma aureum]|uniref:Uncharacterized protein n=1 Tax=Spirosoma aureum TaxID=2692134 RepID=A0A6G9AJ87_9BACT|nr:hypothetical protein [Spirosoma aureum]QIP12243.1 hypothetical protein G8759_06170 [Spirosoma aureum]